MSGLLAGIGTPIGAAETVTQIFAPSARYMVWPVNVGAGITNFGNSLSDLGIGNIGSSLGISDSVMSQLNDLVLPQILTGYVPLVEEHRDELTITEHPVEQGSTISDHAFKLPAMLTLRLGWSTSQPASSVSGINNILTSAEGLLTGALTLPVLAGFFNSASDAYINSIYNTLLTLQVNRTIITVATARRLYQNLLLQSLSLQTDETTEHALVITAIMKEVIIVQAQVVNSPVNSTSNANPPALNPQQPQGQTNLSPFSGDVPAGGLT